jgi:hypothetical protein
MSSLKRISIGAAAAAVVAETGAKNLLLWMLVTVGTPAATTGFVYEVVQMRQTRLQHEANDRATKGAKPDTAPADAIDQDSKTSLSLAEPEFAKDPDLRHRLSAMLIARSHFVDIYGADPESVTPIYKRIAQDMLVADDLMFAKLETEKSKDPARYGIDLKRDEMRLRVLHDQVVTLASESRPLAHPAQGAE